MIDCRAPEFVRWDGLGWVPTLFVCPCDKKASTCQSRVQASAAGARGSLSEPGLRCSFMYVGRARGGWWAVGQKATTARWSLVLQPADPASVRGAGNLNPTARPLCLVIWDTLFTLLSSSSRFRLPVHLIWGCCIIIYCLSSSDWNLGLSLSVGFWGVCLFARFTE